MTGKAEQPIKIFVGTDRSQRIGLRVLEYSIGKHTDRAFEVHSLESVQLPEPEDKRNVQRTGFSFSRFAIPKLCDFTGKAIYMDADMLVFKDIGSLWDIPFDGHKLLIQADVTLGAKQRFKNLLQLRKKRPKQTAVSLLDCAALNWRVEDIVAGLDGQYNYKELMSDLCILDESEIGYRIPPQWNSLEHFDDSTCNLHYTDMHTQPWVCASNPLAYLWLDTVREMLHEGCLSWDELEHEVQLGFARPSLITELKEQTSVTGRSLSDRQVKVYTAEDREVGFQMHEAAYKAKKHREEIERDFVLREKSRSEKPKQFSSKRPLKILFVANSPNLPTLQIAFTQPLSGMVNSGLIETDLLTEWMINENSRIRLSKSLSHRSYIDKQIRKFQPDLILFCRYTGVGAEHILNRARLKRIPIINCLDDDLLNVPIEIGIEKYNYYKDEQRQARMKYLLEHSDLIYSSTQNLSDRIKSYGYTTPVFTASVFCPALKLSPQPIKPQRFGYMGFGHEHDIKEALPGIIQALRQLPGAEFELFGTIAKPTELEGFGARVRMLEPEWDYNKFMQRLANRGWAVGICPLADLPFNDYKASTKWLEYGVVGAAVIASDHPVYRRVINVNTGVLVGDATKWGASIVELLANTQQRADLVAGAQREIAQYHSIAGYELQFVEILKKVGLHLLITEKMSSAL